MQTPTHKCGIRHCAKNLMCDRYYAENAATTNPDNIYSKANGFFSSFWATKTLTANLILDQERFAYRDIVKLYMLNQM